MFCQRISNRGLTLQTSGCRGMRSLLRPESDSSKDSTQTCRVCVTFLGVYLLKMSFFIIMTGSLSSLGATAAAPASSSSSTSVTEGMCLILFRSSLLSPVAVDFKRVCCLVAHQEDNNLRLVDRIITSPTWSQTMRLSLLSLPTLLRENTREQAEHDTF